MTKPLSDAIILVADDRVDVARTLCRPLREAGATLRYVTDGQAALADIVSRPADLVLVDMKMPPEEWGGLWLLRELRTGGWQVPVVALSGEGSKRQVIEALRLGANDWVNKDEAGEQLLDQCMTLLADSFTQALDLASARLPTPLAYRFARYARMTDPDKRMHEGFHALEAVLRFAALLGLSSTPPQPLPGITLEGVRSPSMRTWLNLCAALARSPGAGDDFTQLLSFLIPEPVHLQHVNALISHRNAIAHGRAIPDHAKGQHLDALLRRFAHRAQSAWRADLAVPTCMTYDGSTYSIEIFRLSGIGTPTPGSVESPTSVVTDELVLLSQDTKPLPLAPWLIVQRTEEPGKFRCLQFDGLQRTKGSPGSDTPLRYATTSDEERPGADNHPVGATWQALAPFVSLESALGETPPPGVSANSAPHPDTTGNDEG